MQAAPGISDGCQVEAEARDIENRISAAQSTQVGVAVYVLAASWYLDGVSEWDPHRMAYHLNCLFLTDEARQCS